MKEIFELKLGIVTMDEYGRIFIELLGYVTSSRMRKSKLKGFLVGYLQSTLIIYGIMSLIH
jgi:hypothetical protein